MKVILLRHTPEPEKTVAMAARLCYSDSGIREIEEKVSGISIEKFLGKILKMGHLSVLEHASFTFGIEGISRATSHQLVRHRLASYSQQSQRYVTASAPEYAVPPTIAVDPEKKKLFEAAVKRAYRDYKRLVDAGIPAEDARYLLPNAACTKIIVTMNARELLHFFSLRCCERAQWEIREMAVEMLRCVKNVAPFIFRDSGPSCVRGKCSEGEMTCGKPKETRERFKSL
ncbi:MAG: FAD-dependent thymidylate synthase [Deltaproteobacteria bacterium]|nr:FAD-dependent thymidylate synthase [Deltaproteobacteria bacterium]MBZ0220230.1 FAD-dependent thymidylate synthase [Deltaproteobacteria bacterium]